jgi:hypothetical protein
MRRCTRMKAVRIMMVLGFLFVVTAGVARAGYLSGSDKTISLTLAPSLVKPSGETGEATFQLQEGVHSLLTSTTGAEVDHYYVWVEVNGQKVLAVDPLWTDYD